MLVYRGAVSFDVTEDLVGGAFVSFWDRLKDWIRETRETQNYPMWRERMHQAPAHERYRDWTPSGAGVPPAR